MVAPALCINVTRPLDGGKVPVENGKTEVVVQVTMGCGMPACGRGYISPRGLRVKARAGRDKGGDEAETALEPTGFVGEYRGVLSGLGPGWYELVVEALDASSGMAGRGRVRFRAVPPA